MYAGSLAAKHEAEARQEAAAAGTSSAAAAAAAAAGVPTALEKQQQREEAPLMGKAPAPDEHLSRAERASMLPSFMAAGAPTSQNEQWARMTNDPLLAIKQQEQEALKRVKHNPIKMQQILKEVRWWSGDTARWGGPCALARVWVGIRQVCAQSMQALSQVEQ